MSYSEIIKKDISDFLKENWFYLIIYFFILILHYDSNLFKTIEDTVSNKSSDEWTFYVIAKRAPSAGILGFLILPFKYILNAILINISWLFSNLFKLPDLLIHGLLKSLIHILSVPLFYRIVSLQFNKNISKLSALLYLFDPFLLNLHFCLLRDDLICSFSFLFLYTYIFIITNKDLRSLKYLLIFFLFLLFLRPLQAFSILLSTSFVYQFISKRNLQNIKHNTFKKLNLRFFPYLIASLTLTLLLINQLKQVFIYGVYVLNNTKVNYILIAFKNFYFSPWPNNIIEIISGNISGENYLNPYWALIRFLLLLFTVIFFTLITIHKPYRIKIFSNHLLLISLSCTFIYGIFSFGSKTLGPRQGYFSYLLVLPLVAYALLLTYDSFIKSTIKN